MLHLDEYATSAGLGKTAISCPFCKSPVFGPKGIDTNGEPRLAWHCIHCQADFSSKPVFNELGETKESYKEKIIRKLLEEGVCEAIVRVYATSSKRPPVFIEDELRDLLEDL